MHKPKTTVLCYHLKTVLKVYMSPVSEENSSVLTESKNIQFSRVRPHFSKFYFRQCKISVGVQNQCFLCMQPVANVANLLVSVGARCTFTTRRCKRNTVVAA